MLSISLTFCHFALVDLSSYFLLLNLVEREVIQFLPPFQIQFADKRVVFIIMVIFTVVRAILIIVEHIFKIVIQFLTRIHHV